jgi:polyribonucleotide nucleotidyltransferase
MAKAMDAPRGEVGKNAPRIVQISIPVDKIRDVIGTGGKVIREIVEKTGAKVNVEDDGTVKVASANADAIEAAVKWIKSLTSEPEVGQIYEGKVVKVMEFGAFVNFFGAKDGLVHVSQLARERVEKPGDVVKEGDVVKVKLLGFDDRGKTKLSMKVVDQATGADLSAELGEEAEDHGPRRREGGDRDRGDRGPRRGGGGGRDRPRREGSGE